MPSFEDQIRELEAAIGVQEGLRGAIGDATVNLTITALRRQIEALRAAARDEPPESMPASVAPTSLSPEQLLSRLQSYIPRELASKMRSTGRIEGERKQVTVVFADISGFTALSERLDAEDVAVLTNEVLKELAEAVYQYEGYIDKFIGDAVMAVFGAPVAHEDDAERALRVALAMRERLAQFNRRRGAQIGQPLSLHVGVNTGVVIAGNVGSDMRLSYTVMGDTVNTASRLQDSARPGQVLISRDTYRLAQEAFTFAALDPISAKGKSNPIPAYELLRAKALPGKSRGLAGLGAAFVGREGELGTLRAVMADLEQGRGSIVLLTGEAGLGKSRLMAEWHAEVERGAHWLEGRGFAHTVSLAYGPFLDLLRRFAGISDDDSEADARARLDAAVAQLLPSEPAAAAMLAKLLSLRLTPEEAALVDSLPPQALRHRVFACLKMLFTHLASRRPTLVVLEDLHWADITSSELLDHLLPLTGRLSLAIVGICRPLTTSGEIPSALKLTAEARYADRFVHITLSPLSAESSELMASQLLATPELPDTLIGLLNQRAEGNPFFVEELIRALIERGALVRSPPDGRFTTTPLIESVAIPDTLQGLLMARLDRLPESAKRVAQEASVIGRTFPARILQAITSRARDVDDKLKHLEREELICEWRREPEVEYSFRHALTQEAAYQSLLAPRRRKLHRKAGEAMVELFADRLGEFHSIIGEHFLRGEAWEEAHRYLNQAGDAAARIFAHAEARLHYAAALEALGRLPDSDEVRRSRVDIIVKLDDISFLVNGPTKSLALLTEAESLMQALSPLSRPSVEDRLRLARVHLGISRAHSLRNEQAQAAAYLQQVLVAAEETGDRALLAIPSAAMGFVTALQGRFRESEAFLRRSLDPLEKTENWPYWILAECYLGLVLALRGGYAEGIEELLRAEARSQELNSAIGLAQSYLMLGMAHFFGGSLWRAVATLKQAVEASEAAGDRTLVVGALHFMGWAQSRLGQHGAAAASIAQSKEIEKGASRSAVADWLNVADAEVALNAGCAEDAIRLSDQALAAARAVGSPFSAGLARRVRGQALAGLSSPAWPEAEADLHGSVEALDGCDARLEAARSRIALATLYIRRGDPAAAQAHVKHAARDLEESGPTSELDVARRLLQTL